MTKILKSVLLVSIFTSLTACEPGETSGALQAGQWSKVQQIGSGTFLITGWDTQDAINGANSFCQKNNRSLSTQNIVPNTRRERATVTFSCN